MHTPWPEFHVRWRQEQFLREAEQGRLARQGRPAVASPARPTGLRRLLRAAH